jgi:hypothetical protein
VFGALSLIVWTLIIITSVKYVAVAMSVDNDGEGGILALMSLLCIKKHQEFIIVAIALFGAALIYGDGAITPGDLGTLCTRGTAYRDTSRQALRVGRWACSMARELRVAPLACATWASNLPYNMRMLATGQHGDFKFAQDFESGYGLTKRSMLVLGGVIAFLDGVLLATRSNVNVSALLAATGEAHQQHIPCGSGSWRVCIPPSASAHASLRPREVCVRESNQVRDAHRGRSIRDWH